MSGIDVVDLAELGFEPNAFASSSSCRVPGDNQQSLPPLSFTLAIESKKKKFKKKIQQKVWSRMHDADYININEERK